ncbi:MAG: EVE domain-containing protein [Nitrospinaceae bacterium]|jgi:predicted RNA-binding protein with PUA-like domain|nr:EVE domain-containing protein [Nitrospina sp.]MBT5869049.1 EVE domain-containing protein [Nitrospinaceae bacterium]MBT6347468.1 EVE domain-containing protein [Nitrospina sp.]
MKNKTSFWLVKQEPSKYSWETFLLDGETLWDGVRNYQARNNLQSMKKNDLVFFYHSVTGKEIKGVAQVIREAYPDPTTDDARWVVVDLKPISTMKNCVSLEDIKSHKDLQDTALVKQSRLSVMPITYKESQVILKLGGIRLQANLL